MQAADWAGAAEGTGHYAAALPVAARLSVGIHTASLWLTADYHPALGVQLPIQPSAAAVNRR